MVRFPLEWNQILNRTKYNTFGWVRRDKEGNAGKRLHQGWDLVAPMGTLVFPVATGEVVGVQYSDVGSYGRTINLKFEHEGKTYYAFYAHLLNVLVTKGFQIEHTNIPIGWVGDSGNAKGIAASKVHLHFEFRDRRLPGNGLSNRIDPVDLLGDPPYDGIFYIDDE